MSKKQILGITEKQIRQIVKESVKYVINESDMENNIQQLVNDCVEHILEVKWGNELKSPTDYGSNNIEEDRQYLSNSLYKIIHNIM